jgi:hypothetical protein
MWDAISLNDPPQEAADQPRSPTGLQRLNLGYHIEVDWLEVQYPFCRRTEHQIATPFGSCYRNRPAF